MLAVKATQCVLYTYFGQILGRQSLREGPVDFAEASYTILSLLASLSCHGAAGSVPRSLPSLQWAV